MSFKQQMNDMTIVALTVIPLIFLPFRNQLDFFYLPKVYGMMIVSTLILYFVYKERKHMELWLIKDTVNASLAIYLLFLTLSLFFADNLDLALNGAFQRCEGYSTIMLYMILFSAARLSGEWQKKQLHLVLLTASLVALYGIFQYFGIDPFPRDFIRWHWKETFSTMGNPNFLGTFLLLMLPLAYHNLLESGSKRYLLIYSLLFYCLLFTNTNSAWLGVIASFIVYFILTHNRILKAVVLRKRLYMLSIVTVMIIASYSLISENGLFKEFILMWQDAERIVMQDENYEHAGSNRIFIWKRVVPLIMERPFWGYGIDNLGPVFNERYEKDILYFWGAKTNVDKAHNEYLQIAVTSGIPSLIAYLVFIGFVLKRGFVHIKNKPYYVPFFVAVIGYLAQANFNISVVSVAYVFWIFLGILSSSSESDEENNKMLKAVK